MTLEQVHKLDTDQDGMRGLLDGLLTGGVSTLLSSCLVACRSHVEHVELPVDGCGAALHVAGCQ